MLLKLINQFKKYRTLIKEDFEKKLREQIDLSTLDEIQDVGIKLLKISKRRKDKKYTPLFVEVGNLLRNGFDFEYLLEKIDENYDGRDFVNPIKEYIHIKY